MPTVRVGGKERQYDRGTTFETIVKEFQPQHNNSIALVYFNGKLRELGKRLEKDGAISFITTSDEKGHRAYVRTAHMMLVKAVRNVLGEEGRTTHVKIEFTLGNAYYCTVRGTGMDMRELASLVKAEMQRMAARALPITKKTYPVDDALELFRRQNMEDKVRLFHYRMSSTVNVYSLEGFYDYFYGYMLPSTAYVTLFDVQEYHGGLLLILPTRDDPYHLHDFEDQQSLFDQLMLSTQWGELVNISTVGDLNEMICQGKSSEVILVQEALQERRIAEIARQIYDQEEVKFILVAGPSSSGKTSFANRLSIQLRSFGLRTHIIGMDDYFVNRENTPIDIDGNYDFDVLEAVDLELFNDDMLDLLEGQEIDLPTFDFKLGKRVYKGRTMKLEDNDVLIIEGIHCLNPRSTYALPAENKFKIYVSAMTSLNIDEHNRIPSTDARMLRRMVRDARTRNNDAVTTINGWHKVKDGEGKFIFPFQEDADAVFNSALIYELAVIKQLAEPLLFKVPKHDPAYYEAKRMLKFLSYFVGMGTESVPVNSICREFVGGGCFHA